MGKKKLKVELNGINYLRVSVLIHANNEDKVNSKILKHKCITQGVKKFSYGGFWGATTAIIKVLVPEKELDKWSKYSF